MNWLDFSLDVHKSRFYKTNNEVSRHHLFPVAMVTESCRLEINVIMKQMMVNDNERNDGEFYKIIKSSKEDLQP